MTLTPVHDKITTELHELISKPLWDSIMGLIDFTPRQIVRRSVWNQTISVFEHSQSLIRSLKSRL